MEIIFALVGIAFMAMIPIFWPALIIGILFELASGDGVALAISIYTFACMAFSYWYHFIINKKPDDFLKHNDGMNDA